MNVHARTLVWTATLLGCLAGCDPTSTTPDAGADVDAPPRDAGSDLDAPTRDGGGSPDALFVDVPPGPDAPTTDDAGSPDAGSDACVPGTEICNLLDDDCDGDVDEELTTVTFYPDCDSDGAGGVGTDGMTMMVCALPPAGPAACPTGTWSVTDDDCDDAQAAVHPGGTELCNLLDDDCNGTIDEGVTTAFFTDCDGDGFGVGTAVDACSAPPPAPTCAGWATVAGDCDDTHASAHPGITGDVCDGLDDDCNGTVDDATTTSAWCNDPSRALPHATAACTAGACTLATCDTGFGDCTSAPGCETSLTANDAACGACGRACLRPGCAASVCANDVVEIMSNPSGGCARYDDGRVACWGNGFGLVARAIPEITDAVRLVGTDSAVGNGCAIRRSGQVTCLIATSTTAYYAATVGPFVDIRDAHFLRDTASASQWTLAVLHSTALSVYSTPGSGAAFTSFRTYPPVPEVMSFAVELHGGGAGDWSIFGLRADGTLSLPFFSDPRYGSAWTRSGVEAVACTTTTFPAMPFMTVRCVLFSTGHAVSGIPGNWYPTVEIPRAPTFPSTARMLDHGFILLEDGTAQWADAMFSPLSTIHATAPGYVTLPPVTMVSGDGISDQRRNHGCALLRSGAVMCWGRGTAGALGNGGTANSGVPVTVMGL